MSGFPKIDSPCPLDAAAQAGIDGHCARCDKAVHRLDDMSEAQRRTFMRQASQPVCVSYRIPAIAALAMSMAVPVQARNPHTAAAVDQPVGQEATRTEPGSGPSEGAGELEYIFVGGVSKPGEAKWMESDAPLPELPMVSEPEETR